MGQRLTVKLLVFVFWRLDLDVIDLGEVDFDFLL